MTNIGLVILTTSVSYEPDNKQNTTQFKTRFLTKRHLTGFIIQVVTVVQVSNSQEMYQFNHLRSKNQRYKTSREFSKHYLVSMLMVCKLAGIKNGESRISIG